MCRRNQVCGLLTIAFGVGFLTSRLITSGFACILIGIAAICMGFLMLCRNSG